MYNVSTEWIDRLQKKEYPTPYALVETSMGYRVFGGRNLQSMETVLGVPYADGTYYADGSVYAGIGYVTVLSFDARVISFGSVDRTLRPKSDDLLIGYSAKEQATVSLELDNGDYYFNDILRTEPMLSKRMQIKIGYHQDPAADHITLFNGLITKITFSSKTIIIEALEELDDLSEYYFLNRAGRFTNPLNTNDRLPIVYGDLSEGIQGNWRMPCIDTVNYVYCFAGHEVLSVANGNTISVFINDLEIDSADYTFSHSNPSYENMATITLNSDAGTTDVLASGKGKDAGGGVLMQNIVDIVDDLLTNEVGWSGSLQETKKAISKALFDEKNLVAAGIISEDFDIWEKIKQMVASFYGIVYLNGENELVVNLDIKEWSSLYYNEVHSIISAYKSEITSGEMMLKGIVNHLPASYAYDYYRREFKAHTDASTYQDEISQYTYGDRSPGPYQFYWCRDTASINALQDILVNKLKDPRWQLKVKDISLDNIHIEIGDIVQFSAQNYYMQDGDELLNEYFLIIAHQLNLDDFTVNFKLVDTGNYKLASLYADGTYYADGSVYAGGRDSTIY